MAQTSLRFYLLIRGACLFRGLDPTGELYEGRNPDFQEPPDRPISRKHIKNMVASWPLSFSEEAKPLGETLCKTTEGMTGSKETMQIAGIYNLHRADKRTDSII